MARGGRPEIPTKDVRASDQDREQVVTLLRGHFADGRLSETELSARVERAYAARTLSELEALTLDLPSSELALPSGRQAAPETERYVTSAGHGLRLSLRIHLTIYAVVNVMLIGIWAVTGAGYFWPIWPLLGWGIGLGVHAAPVIAGVGTRSRTPASRRLPAPSSIEEVAASVDAERPSLRPAAALDGTVTILFSDIEDSTRLNERLGDTRWLELLREHHRIVREQVRASGGFEVKVQGDGFMVTFPGVRQAVQCARGIQAEIASGLGGHPDGPIRVRIGLHTGEALREQDDFYGRNVVLAARITEQARGGEILASAVVKELAASGGDIGFDDEREVALDGLTGMQRVYRVT